MCQRPSLAYRGLAVVLGQEKVYVRCVWLERLSVEDSRIHRPTTKDISHVVGLFAAVVTLVVCLLFGNISNPTAIRMAYFLSNSGNTLFIAIGLALLATVAALRRDWGSLRFLVIAAILVQVLISFLKLTIGHWLPRPSGSLGGFPSGHAFASFAVAYALSQKFPRLTVLWYACAVAVSWSRVELHAHYTYQVIGGALIGLEAAVISVRWNERRRSLGDS